MNINGDMKPIDESAGEDEQRKHLAFVLPKELEIKGKIKNMNRTVLLFQGAMQRIVFTLLKKVV